MPLNKLQLKAKVFEFLEPLRNLSAVDNLIIIDTLNKIKSINDADFEFVSKLLIKEADENSPKTASAFLYMAHKIAPESFVNFVFSELNSKNVSDRKKIFLMNIMAGLGINFLPEDLNNYFINPAEAIENETKKFIDAAKIEPDPVIDFLDFYFASGAEDKNLMLNSVISDFEGDGYINLISTLMTSSDDSETILYCLKMLEKENSPLLLKPLEYLSKKEDAKISQKASKMLRKLSLKGITHSEKIKLYKKFLSNFNKPKIQITFPDGNSNFSVIISRKAKDNAYYLLFIAINLDLGPFSCFGFSKITKNDHDSILKGFFKNGEKITIENSSAKKILDTLTMKRISINKALPYEFLAWEKIIEDIEPNEASIEEILKEGLNKIKITEEDINKLYKNKIVQNWFFRPSKINPCYLNFIETIERLKEDEFFKAEKLLSELSDNIEIKNLIKKRLLFFAFCLKNKGKKDLADIYYSLIYNDKLFLEFIINIIKNSIYEHFLQLREYALNTRSFILYSADDAQKFIDYIEKSWVK